MLNHSTEIYKQKSAKSYIETCDIYMFKRKVKCNMLMLVTSKDPTEYIQNLSSHQNQIQFNTQKFKETEVQLQQLV